jgi:hypothetical protein
MILIDNLLRLRRRECEEHRRYVAELDLLAERLRADARRLRAEIERLVAAGDPLLAQPLVERHDKVERSVAAIESQMAAAGDALAAAEEELKRHEMAAAQRAGNERLAGRRSRRGRPRPASPIAGPGRDG